MIKKILALMIALSVILTQIPANLGIVFAVQEVSVDYAADDGNATYRASGFLSGFDYDGNQPSAEVVDPLKIRFHRSSVVAALTQVDRMRSIGAIQQAVVSESWGYRSSNAFPGDNGDWGTFETFVVNLVNEFKSKGIVVQYDIWNEPDFAQYWSRSVDQYREMWRRAVIKIRETDPTALIAGPDFFVSKPGSHEFWSFLQYCKDNNVVPDILAWHFPNDVIGEVNMAREYIEENNLPIKQIQINEFGIKTEQYSGRTAKYLAQFERCKVDVASRAVFGGTWEKGDLDEILYTQDGKWHTRGEWWVYKAYSDITGTLVKTQDTSSIDLIAGKDADMKESRILLGNSASSAPGSVTVHLNNIDQVPYLLNENKAHIVVEKIPGTWNEVTNLPVVSDQIVTVNNNQIDVNIDWSNKLDAYTIRIEPFDPLQPTPTQAPPETPTPEPQPTDVPGKSLTFLFSNVGTKINQFSFSNGTDMVLHGRQTTPWGMTATGTIYNDQGSSDATVSYKFEGTKVKLYGETARYSGIAGISILDSAGNIEIPEQLVDLFTMDILNNQLVYTSPELAQGIHTIRVRITGDYNEMNLSSNWSVALSKIEVMGAPTPTPLSTATPTLAPTETPTLAPTATPEVTPTEDPATLTPTDQMSVTPEASTTFEATPAPTPVVPRTPLLNDINSHWGKDFINNLYDLHIVNGYPGNNFRPDSSITRAELAVILTKALGLTPVANPQFSFTDTSKIPSWAAGSIAVLVEQDIIVGYSDGTFRPNDRIRRSEMAVMIIKGKEIDVSGVSETTFADNASIPVWAKKYVAKSSELEIISGYADNSKPQPAYVFKPLNNVTRAETCVMITKMMNPAD